MEIKMRNLEIELKNRFSILRPVGRGAFATVFQVTETAIEKPFALKVYESNTKDKARREQIIDNEVTILSQLKNSNVVGFHEVIRSSQHVSVLLDLVEGMTLTQYLYKTRTKKVPEKESLRIFSQVINCVSGFHQMGIFHRDLKLSNVMINKNRDIVLIDFGFAIFNQEKKDLSSFCGTLNYVAPEVVKNQPHQPGPVDVWALGVLLFRLLTGNYPFECLIKSKARRDPSGPNFVDPS